MIAFNYTVKRWWWRKWPPLVRVGWLVSRNAKTSVGTAMGLGLIAAALAFRPRKAVKIYNAKVPDGEMIAVRVLQNGRPISAS